MKNTKRKQPRRAARTPGQAARVHDRLEAKLLKLCADIGWICGWREERLEPAPTARPSSRKRVMLGRALAAEAKARENEAFRPVESTFVSSGRTAYVPSEATDEASGLADIADDLQDELARLGCTGINTSALVGALGDAKVRSLDRQLWERRRSML